MTLLSTSPKLRFVANVLRETWRKYWADQVERRGAALAFYAMFTLAPVLTLAVRVAGALYGEDAASGRLQAQLRDLVGPAGADVIGAAMLTLSQPGAGEQATLLSALAIFVGASGAFLELQAAMNQVWECPPLPETAWVGFLRRRVLSFLMVLALGLVLVLSGFVSTVLGAVGEAVAPWVHISLGSLQWIHHVSTFVVSVPLLVLVFTILPDRRVPWWDALRGSVVTALLIGLGQQLVAGLLVRGVVLSAYGAAGALAVVLVSVYVAAQTLLLGAELTRAWSIVRRRPTEDGSPP